jgi:1-hydroxycarotenoid 3,4-desaturase
MVGYSVERRLDSNPVIIIGAGIGGLVSAALLSARGLAVTLIEKEATPGGKVRQLDVDGAMVDGGPTVFTMRPELSAIFAAAGAQLDDHVTLEKADVLARHAWDDSGTLDLYADHEKSVDAVGRFAGLDAAKGYQSFSREAENIYNIIEHSFLKNTKAYPPALMWRVGWWRMGAMHAIKPYTPMWKALGAHFSDPRLRQLFGRYATYCGSSPYETPATLTLIAHVEAQGVWKIKGGISALAKALENVARRNGATIRYGEAVDEVLIKNGKAHAVQLANGEVIEAASVICNADPSALAYGLFGERARDALRPMPEEKRSLSAMVWLINAKSSGFDLEHHNVFFSDDYAREFRDIKAGGPPVSPTSYLCALDRGAELPEPDNPNKTAKIGTSGKAERFQIIVNAPANGDSKTYSAQERETCTRNMLDSLNKCGLELEHPLPHKLVTPNEFAKLFPATGGALYGRASHGWAASFLRPGCRTRIKGLYCAGGGTHPGAGVPMAALSGKIASEAVLSDRASKLWYHRKAINGGMSTRSVMTGNSA